MCRSHVSVVFFHPHSHVFEPRVERKLQGVFNRVDKRVVSHRHTHVDRGKPHGQPRVNVHDPNLSHTRRNGTRCTGGGMKRERMPRGEATTTTSHHHRRWRSKTCQTEMRMRWTSDADASESKHVNGKTSTIVGVGNPRSLTRPFAPHGTTMGTIQITCTARSSIVQLNDILASRQILSFRSCKPNRPNPVSCAMFHRYLNGCRRHRLSSITHGRTQPWMLDKGERFTNH